MAQNAPPEVEALEIQFKRQCKTAIFPTGHAIPDNCNLISTASAYGLVFVGTPLAELKVFQLSSITSSHIKDTPIPIRTISLPSVPTNVSVNCDGSMVVVDVNIQNTPFICVYAVPTFLSQQVKMIQNIRLSTEANVRPRQFCWNPAIPESLAVCLNNGAMVSFVIRESGYEINSIDKSQGVTAICWSPKGKQIVVAHPNLRLIQYKPELTAARSVQCPMDVSWGNNPTILAIQWVSNFQFLVALLPQTGDACPILLVVNAPKSNQITMVNYGDICYSNSGPRAAQVFISHVQAWNLLIIATSNSIDVGVLATKEAGDTPTWQQYIQSGESRADLPLSSDRQEMFPVGLALDTASTHRLIIGEDEINEMPMVHLLSTAGQLVSFNLLNLFPNVPGLCAPPRPIQDQSGLNQFIVAPIEALPSQPEPVVAATSPVEEPVKPAEMTFNIPVGGGQTSTPDITQKSRRVFGVVESGSQQLPVPSEGLFSTLGGATATTTSSLFGSVQAKPFQMPPKPTTTLEPPVTGVSFGQKPVVVAPTTAVQQQKKAVVEEPTKPLISVSAKFNATTGPSSTSANPESNADGGSGGPLATDIDNEVIGLLIQENVLGFEKDLKELISRCRNLNVQIGETDQCRQLVKQLMELTDFGQQANESSDQLRSEVRSLNLSLNEAFAMSVEAKSLFAMYKNPQLTKMQDYTTQNQTNRRQMLRLQTVLTNNGRQLDFIQKQLSAQWAAYEDVKRQYSKDRMHIPCLESVYETLTRQREILFREREVISYIKAKLGVKLLHRDGGGGEADANATVDSIADSILSMTLFDKVNQEAAKMSAKKLGALTKVLEGRPVMVIRPSRPDRKEINSEVILERREQLVRQRQQGQVSAKATPITASATVSKSASVALQKPKETDKVATAMAPPAAVTTKPLFGGLATKPATTPLSFGGPPPAAATPVPVATSTPAIKPLAMSISTGTTVNKENTAPNVIVKAPETTMKSFGFGAAAGGPAKPEVPATTTAAVSKVGAPTTTGSLLFGGSTGGGLNFGAASFVTPKPPVATGTSTEKGASQEIKKPEFSFSLPPSTTITPTTAPVVATFTMPVSSAKTEHAKTVNVEDGLKDVKVCAPTTGKPQEPAKNIFANTAFGAAAPTTAAPAAASVAVSTIAPSIAPAVVKPKVTSGTPMFGGFGSAATTTTTTSPAAAAASPAISNSPVTTVSTPQNSPSIATTVTATTAATTTASEPKWGFGTAPVTTSAPTITPTSPPSGLFSGLPKPDQSVFGQAPVPTPVAAAAAVPVPSQTAAPSLAFGSMSFGGGASAPNPTPAPAFESSQAASTNVFGGGGGSMFGGAGSAFGASPGNNTTGSMFGGGTATTSPPTGNIFGGGFQAAQNTGSIFGGGVQQQSQNNSPFGGGGSPAAANGNTFGQAAANPSSGGNLFGDKGFFGGGGGAASTTPAGTSVFGGGVPAGGNTAAASSFSFASPTPAPAFGTAAAPAFGATNTNNAATFGATPSPNTGFGQSAFGSTSPFQKPASTFGAAPAFGQAPTFGGAPVFGGGATFGSPTGFGSSPMGGGGGFGVAAAQQTAAPAQNNLFASLGASDTGPSFGNLAQSNANQQQSPQFGGTAFSSWR